MSIRLLVLVCTSLLTLVGAPDSHAFSVLAHQAVVLDHQDGLVPTLVLAGALLAFTLSLDDFVITFFTSGPDTTTFPVKVYSMVRFTVTPEVNAASTLLIVLTVSSGAVDASRLRSRRMSAY